MKENICLFAFVSTRESYFYLTWNGNLNSSVSWHFGVIYFLIAVNITAIFSLWLFLFIFYVMSKFGFFPLKALSLYIVFNCHLILMVEYFSRKYCHHIIRAKQRRKLTLNDPVYSLNTYSLDSYFRLIHCLTNLKINPH